jgi:hypothetical protein
MPAPQYFKMIPPRCLEYPAMPAHRYIEYPEMWDAPYDNQPVMNAARHNHPAHPGAMLPPQRPAMPAHEYLEYLESPEMWHAA